MLRRPKVRRESGIRVQNEALYPSSIAHVLLKHGVSGERNARRCIRSAMWILTYLGSIWRDKFRILVSPKPPRFVELGGWPDGGSCCGERTRSKATLVDPVQSLSTVAPKPCLWMFPLQRALRLVEIDRRNELRREAKLPVLSIPKLRRMETAEYEQEFSRFCEVHIEAVWKQVLCSRRAIQGPNWRASWRPGFMTGIAYQNQVYRILHEQFQAERKKHSNLIA
jgi:hypothetical protein